MTEYEALYRKYRPQNFDEIIGQDTPLLLLKKAVSEKKPSHAYLFSGSRGTGKTSLARIFAKSLGINPEDIYELDAASNRGVDEVRSLRESIHTLPFSSPYKMYILDEAHMLTKEASNALLKTLEEPPAHVLFILATTDKEKLPDTIHSRCQIISFGEPSSITLSNHIITIASKEGYLLTESSVELISKEARGSFRDALGILETVLRASDTSTIEEIVVRKILGISDEALLSSLLENIFGGELSQVHIFLTLAKEKNTTPENLFRDLLGIMRNLLLYRIGVTSFSQKEKIFLSEMTTKMKIPVQSKHILYLLEKAPLLSLSEENAWVALTVLLFELQTLP